MWNFKDRWWNLECFKSGGKRNIYVLAGLGVIHSIWTYGAISCMLESRTYDERVIVAAIEKTYVLIYLSSAIGLIWGLHISELRYVKIWNGHKYAEIAVNIVFFILFASIFTLINLLNLVLGVYVVMSVWNHCQNVEDSNTQKSSIEENNYILTKYSYVDFPTVHK